MSRGCPYKCSYCINVQLQEIYRHAGPENYHREKSIDRVISEIKYAREYFDIEFLKFWDETFLLMSEERMEEFSEHAAEMGNKALQFIPEIIIEREEEDGSKRVTSVGRGPQKVSISKSGLFALMETTNGNKHY